MRATHRRAIGIAVTGIYLAIYIFFAAALGGLFADKHWSAQVAFFAVAGIIWVVPLRPLFQWMRVPDPEEIPVERPPEVSVVKRR